MPNRAKGKVGGRNLASSLSEEERSEIAKRLQIQDRIKVVGNLIDIPFCLPYDIVTKGISQ